MASLEAFVLWKEAFLRRLKAKGISIPKKSKKGQTLLEHLAGVLEGELKRELIRLIRARERILLLLLPTLKRIGKDFLSKRLGVSPSEIERLCPSGNFEAVLEQAARQGLDRMSPEKIGIRIDFVLSALARLVPIIQQERHFLRLSSERWTECGEVQEWRIEGGL